MQCNEFLRQAESWMDGQQDPAAAAHLQACPACAALVADLDAIHQSASVLAEVEPPARVWVSLRNQLEVEGLIHEPAALPAVPARRRVFFGLRPALASAYLAAVLVFGGFLAYRGGNLPGLLPAESPANALGDDHGVMLELASLARQTAPEMHEHNPAVQAAYRQNLQIVDNAIAMCEKTIKEQPRNEMARDHLLSAYQQKAELLASMSERGARGD
jgi:anti-sigma factor RsiW